MVHGWHGPCGNKREKSQWPQSTEQRKIGDTKQLSLFQNLLAVKDFQLFMKSVILQCSLVVFFLCKNESFLPLDGL